MTTNENSVFKAVGIIKGNVSLAADRNDKTQQDVIEIDGIIFNLFTIPTSKGYWARHALERQIKNTNSTQTLLVYPKVLHVPQRDVEHKLGFFIVGFHRENYVSSNTLWDTLKVNDFLISGLFQRIPVCKNPVLTVFKNFSQERIGFIKDASPVVRAGFMRPSHIPINYYDSPVLPYRHNKDAKEQAVKFFLEIKATFNSRKNVFVFDSLVNLPKEEAPAYLHVSKKDKLKAFAFKQQLKKQSTRDKKILLNQNKTTQPPKQLIESKSSISKVPLPKLKKKN